MTQRTTYARFYTDRQEAYQSMVLKNQTSRDNTIYVLIDGPEDDYAVVDLASAIDMDALYEWSVR